MEKIKELKEDMKLHFCPEIRKDIQREIDRLEDEQ